MEVPCVFLGVHFYSFSLLLKVQHLSMYSLLVFLFSKCFAGFPWPVLIESCKLNVGYSENMLYVPTYVLQFGSSLVLRKKKNPSVKLTLFKSAKWNKNVFIFKIFVTTAAKFMLQSVNLKLCV